MHMSFPQKDDAERQLWIERHVHYLVANGIAPDDALKALPVKMQVDEVHRTGSFTIQVRQAEQYRKGAVFLAGDAAHVNNPIGGMGMNSGIHDGINLAEKLGRIWRGEAGEELLDLYDRQRRPTAEKYVQAQTIQNKEILQENDPESRAKRLDSLRAIAADRAEHINYLRRVSLIAMVEEANSIT